MGRLLIAAASLALAGCATMAPAPVVYHVQAKFDQDQATRLVQDGKNTVKGSAFMRQRGGGVVTCAGNSVFLIPATAYAVERFQFLYGTTTSGTNAHRKQFQFVPDPPGYMSTVKATKCDAQGAFIFEGVADGEFFVQTTVAWQVGSSLQGGNLMQRVRVEGGKATSLILSA